VNVPAPGEQVSGDVYGVVQQSDAAVCLLADGLGHGQAAADAGVKARSVFASRAFDSPRQVLEAAHVEMRGTRGAAIAIARVDLVRGSLKFAGVGNISGTLLAAGASQGLCSHNGTLGVEARKFQEFDYPWAADTVLVLHSDGLQSRWKLQDYPGLVHRHPAVSAGILYRDYCRGRDDATVIVAKLRNGQERKSG
jgi:serine phosphatase RsbU (regulator of sigma subunit)